jgi:predicted SprT family Zn-dependent metalloprotease
MMEYPFDCPYCHQRYWREESVVEDDRFDDSVCWKCAEEQEVSE